MTNPKSPDIRAVDGPKRRPDIAPISPDPRPTTTARTQTVPPADQAAEPVFEYKKPKKRHWWRWIIITAVVIVLLVGAALVAKTLLAVRNITGKSQSAAPALAGDQTKLKGEGDGRVNILLLGVGGGKHAGANLSDTIMVVSINPQNKDVAMLSIPRDLYVKMPKAAQKSAFYAKINAANAYAGPEAAKEVVQTVLGVPIHYYSLVDFSGFQQAVDAVGGVDITVKEALYDSGYPCDKNPSRSCGYSQPAGTFHMNGATALKYARCRKGNCGLDYGRAAHQQEVLVALRNRALSVSTLTNPVKLAGLIDSVGSHVKTDLSLNEMKKLAEIMKDVDTSKVVNKVLDAGKPDSLLRSGSNIIAGAGDIAVPVAGLYEYEDIHDFVKNLFPDPYIKSENALVQVQNGSGTEGLASKVVKSLKSAGYKVSEPMNAPATVTKTVIYDYTGGKKAVTLRYLEKRFGVTAVKATPTPVASGVARPDIVVVLGRNFSAL
jgi:polyisoprenyl-teichoic acid--peptidoglycan teichoic acid transferase